MLAKEQKLIKKVPTIVNEVRAGSTTRKWCAPAMITPRSSRAGAALQLRDSTRVAHEVPRPRLP
jgi:hypothetical protein